MTTKFRVPIAGLSAVLLLLLAAVPEAESHSRSVVFRPARKATPLVGQAVDPIVLQLLGC